MFPTFRSTLTMKSTYFEKRLSGRFSDDAGDSEIIVDRDHEPFSILLSYLRSGKLSVPSDQLTLRLVLIEADFYGIDELVDMVRDKCYCNLNHIESKDYDEARQKDCKREFPSYEQIIEHIFFPSMYFDKVNYHRVVSTQMLPESKYVRLQIVNGTVEFIEVWQSVTYECLLTRAVQVEPLLCLVKDKDKPSWLSIKSPTEWRNYYNANFDRQQVPVSFWLGLKRHLYRKDWHTATKTEYKPNEGTCLYTIKQDNQPVNVSPQLVKVYNVNSHRNLDETVLCDYGSLGKLVNVKTFGNFMHIGSKTEADIALAAAAATTTASDTDDDSGSDSDSDSDSSDDDSSDSD